MKPKKAQGRNLFASFETGSSRNVRPISLRSRIEVDPTSEMIPKICNVSMIGNSHDESRIAVPQPVCCSQRQIPITPCIHALLGAVSPNSPSSHQHSSMPGYGYPQYAAVIDDLAAH